jgi:hypothetical protein
MLSCGTLQGSRYFSFFIFHPDIIHRSKVEHSQIPEGFIKSSVIFYTLDK